MFGLPPQFRWAANADVAGIPVLVLILVTTYLVFHFVLRHTRFGRYIYLIGGNPTAPFRAGIPVDRILISVFVLAGLLAAFAGWLLAARTNAASACFPPSQMPSGSTRRRPAGDREITVGEHFRVDIFHDIRIMGTTTRIPMKSEHTNEDKADRDD